MRKIANFRFSLKKKIDNFMLTEEKIIQYCHIPEKY